MNDAASIINSFFFEFSRTEHGLKHLGYFAGFGDENFSREKVSVDWRRVAIEIDGRGNELPACVQAIIASPPMKQVVRHGAVIWAEGERGSRSDIDWALELLRRVRNNLFHGEKLFGDVQMVPRDCELVKLALEVLRWLRVEVPNLAMAFPDAGSPLSLKECARSNSADSE
jgi:hypothetical protein